MIKRGDKGTLKDNPARVIADDIKGENPLAIEVVSPTCVYVALRKSDGSSDEYNDPFIPSKPWDSLKPMDVCFVRSDESMAKVSK